VFQDGSGGPPSFERRRPENRTPCPRIPTRRQRRKTRPRRTEVRARLAGLRSRGARAHTKCAGGLRQLRPPEADREHRGSAARRGAPRTRHRASGPLVNSSGSRRPTRGEVRSVVRALLNPRPATVPEGTALSPVREPRRHEQILNLPVRPLGLHPFTPERFHVLLNSLFKVLFNFPSRYLFAIGLVVIFSLRWSLPPA
jgi:hypothetical protein